MRLKPIAVNDFKGYRKTKLQKFIIDFIESELPVAEVIWSENDYKTYASLQSSLATSIKKMNKSGIQVKAIDRRVYLINKALYEREVELLSGKEKKEKSSDAQKEKAQEVAAGSEIKSD